MNNIMLVFMVFLSACSSVTEMAPPDLRPRQNEVIELIWYGLLAEKAYPPEIEWVPGSPCKGLPDPAIVLGTEPDVICAAGTYTTYRVKLVIPIRSQNGDLPFLPFSSSVIVHELVHAHLDLMYGDMDSTHREYPEVWALVPIGNLKLVSFDL